MSVKIDWCVRAKIQTSAGQREKGHLWSSERKNNGAISRWLSLEEQTLLTARLSILLGTDGRDRSSSRLGLEPKEKPRVGLVGMGTLKPWRRWEKSEELLVSDRNYRYIWMSLPSSLLSFGLTLVLSSSSATLFFSQLATECTDMICTSPLAYVNS